MKKRVWITMLACALFMTVLALPVCAEEGNEEGGGGTADLPHTHTFENGVVTQAPTCTVKGIKTFTCSCGETRTEEIAIAPDAHTNTWTSTATGHKTLCSACGASGTEAAHTWNAGTVTPATCQNQGVKEFQCTVCSYRKSEVIPASTAHNYGEWTKVDDATHNRTCKDCGRTDTAAAHAWGIGRITKEATCKEAGSQEFACTCGAKKTEAIAKLTTHTYDNACDADCNVCGTKRDAAHKISNAWSRDGKHHWHVCSVCQQKFSEEDHYPGPAATEEKDQLCLTCGYLLTPKKNHTHSYSDTLSSDDSGHWYACSDCADQKDLSLHVYDNDCDAQCNACGYVRDYAHYYGDTLEYDEAEHWGICTICGEVGTRSSHIAGDAATEDAAQICIICGMEMAAPADHVHEPEEGWFYNDSVHQSKCACGEVLLEESHTWETGEADRQGNISDICSQCGAERIRTEQKAEEEEAEEAQGFPWMLIVIGMLLIGAAAAAVVLVMILKKPKGRFYR